MDETVLLWVLEAELQEIVNRLDQAGSKHGMLITVDETKTMVTSGTICHIRIQGNQLEHADTIPYLGSLITKDSVWYRDSVKTSLGTKCWNSIEKGVEKSQ